MLFLESYRVLSRCYLAELPLIVKHSTVSLFAADTMLYKSDKTVEDCQLLHEDLNGCLERADIWQMVLNPDKS